jgi:hypothetical protein
MTTPLNLSSFITIVENERYAYTQASQYYQKLSYMLSIPSIMCALVTSVLSLISTSVVVTPTEVVYLQLVIGLCGSISSVLQSVQSSLAWGSRSTAFRSAAMQYDHILIRLRFEHQMPDEPEFLTKMETRMLEIRSQCHFMLPAQYLEKKEY